MNTFKLNTIGIVGHGFVGEAIEKGMKHAFKVLIYDPYKYPMQTEDAADLNSKTENFGGLSIIANLDELTKRAEFIFVAVPTPMNIDGSSSTKLVDTVVAQIAEFGRKNVIIIKSTVPPGTTERLHREFAGNLAGVVFNPEFLTEANYIEDFKNQKRIILGCEDDDVKSRVKAMYQRAYPKVPTVKTNPTIAEMVKYTTNCFLATKLSFANEIYQVCEALDIDYDKVIEYMLYDDRIGKSHWAVPGPDGQVGWGLSCFPKDLNALMSVARRLGVDPKVMSAVWRKNLEVRPDRDWEKMKKAMVETVEPEFTFYWSRAPGKFVKKKSGDEILSSSSGGPGPSFMGTIREWYETLVETVIDAKNVLTNRTEAGMTVKIEVSPEVQTILETSVAWRPYFPSSILDQPVIGPDGRVVDLDPDPNKPVGTLNRDITVVASPYAHRNVIVVTVLTPEKTTRVGHVKVLDLNILEPD